MWLQHCRLQAEAILATLHVGYGLVVQRKAAQGAEEEVPLLPVIVDLHLLPGQDCCPADMHKHLVACLCCRAYLEEHVLPAPVERPVYLLGESFGALPSIAVAARRPDLVDRWA